MPEFDPTLVEAKALLNAAWNSSDDERRESLIAWAKGILKPLAETGCPTAKWLMCALLVKAENTEAEFDKEYWKCVEGAAKAGSLEAKFSLACELDEEPTRARSAQLFKEVAESGDPYAMWCHGLNLYSGTGLAQNIDEGLRFIRRSAEGNFEGAIKFVSDAYATGTHGFSKDEKEAAKWLKRLSQKNVISY